MKKNTPNLKIVFCTDCNCSNIILEETIAQLCSHLNKSLSTSKISVFRISYGDSYLQGLFESLQGIDQDSTEHIILIFLADPSRFPEPISGPLQTLSLFVSSAIMRNENKGKLIFLPLALGAPNFIPILNELPGSPNRFLLPLPTDKISECFGRLYRLIMNLMTYAPGKAPKVDVYTQFASDHPFSYPTASLLEFEPVVQSWDEIR